MALKIQILSAYTRTDPIRSELVKVGNKQIVAYAAARGFGCAMDIIPIVDQI
jgi:hypothetical protein